MENDTEVIRQQMEETRSALSEKVEAVEELVSSAVKETAQAVTKTVETVTNSVENTVNTVSDSVESVKEAFNVSACVDKYPWGAMAGSVALGYTLGCLLAPPKEGTSTGTSTGTWGGYAPSPPASTGETAPSSSGNSFLSSWMPLIDKVRGLAVGSAAGLLGEMVMNMVPDNLKSEVSRLVDDATRNLGGTIVRKDHPDAAG